MTDIQVIYIEDVAGRKHEYIQIFGFRPNDARRRCVQVNINSRDLLDILAHKLSTGSFPVVEVPDNSWAYFLARVSGT